MQNPPFPERKGGFEKEKQQASGSLNGEFLIDDRIGGILDFYHHRIGTFGAEFYGTGGSCSVITDTNIGSSARFTIVYSVLIRCRTAGSTAGNGNNPIEGIDYIVTFIKNSREAPALFKANNKYYMITSGCTGWNPNPAEYAISDNILGEWKIIGNPCTDEGSSTTYDTQSTCVYKVNETENLILMDIFI